VKTQSEHKIKAFQLNNDGEFVSEAFNRFLKYYSIENQIYTLYTPQQNGMIEHANYTIVEMVKKMFHVETSRHCFRQNMWPMQFMHETNVSCTTCMHIEVYCYDSICKME
jgi:hypothetical protein